MIVLLLLLLHHLFYAKCNSISSVARIDHHLLLLLLGCDLRVIAIANFLSTFYSHFCFSRRATRAHWMDGMGWDGVVIISVTVKSIIQVLCRLDRWWW